MSRCETILQNDIVLSPDFVKLKKKCFDLFDSFDESGQVTFIQDALCQMNATQHSHVYSHLKAMLQRDFISLLPKRGLDHIAEKILGYLDSDSLQSAAQVRIYFVATTIF